ncbi:hypothetical protein [Corynebacterium nuruki]|uniref:hypothetical protein n=1 Tax=Corynebacterium nuruki TaxID=1032851 RepID=UPI0039BF742A
MSENNDGNNEWGQAQPQPQNITVSPNITVASASTEWFRIIATVGIIAGVVLLGYWLAEFGALEVAATGVTMFIFQMFRLMVITGALKLPSSKRFEQNGFEKRHALVQFLVLMYEAYQETVAQAKTVKLAVMAFGFTVSFLVSRWVMTLVLGVVTNIFFAIAVGVIIGSLIVAPGIVTGVMAKMRDKKTGGE